MTADVQYKKENPAFIRPIVIFVIIIYSFIVPLAGAQTKSLPDNRTAITAVIHKDYIPTSFHDQKTNKAAGFAVDVMDEIASRAGLAVSYRFEKDWVAIIDTIKSGKADIAPGIGLTAERQELLALTLPIAAYPVSIFVRSKSNVSGLGNGVSVGVIKGSAAYETIKKSHDNISFRNYESFAEGLFDLLAGHIDAFCCPAPTLMRLAVDAGVEDKIRIVGPPLVELKQVMAMRKDDAELFTKLNAVIKDFVGSPEYRRIYTKWYGEPRPLVAVSGKTLLTTGMVLLAIGAVVLWRYISIAGLNRKLQQEILERRQAEDALIVSRKMFSALFDSAKDGILQLSAGGDVVALNASFARMHGYTVDEMLKMNLKDLDIPESAQLAPARFQRMLAGEPLMFEVGHYCKNGQTVPLEVSANTVTISGEKYILGFHRDITERKRADEKLKKSERRLLESQQVAKIGSWSWDVVSNTLDWSDETFRRFDKDPATFTTSVEYFVGLIHPDDRDAVQKAMQDTLENDTPYFIQPRIINETGREWVLEGFGRVERDKDGKPLRFAGTAQDITERKKIENALRESESLFRSIYSNIGIGIALIGKDMKIISVNPQMQKWFPHIDSTQQLLCYRSFNVPPQDHVCSYCPTVHTMKDGQIHIAVTDTPTEQGLKHYQIIATPLLAADGSIAAVIEMVEDITERRRTEDQIQQSLHEKETLLRELYHRTKNNMQVITSLINLQSRDIEDKKTLQIFEDTKNRIQSMSLVHEKLYKAKNLSEVDLGDYIEDLANALMQSHNTDKNQISLNVDVEMIPVSIDTVMPLGLVINELMTNALKYAFPDNRKGALIIKASLNEDETIGLIFSDNGIGMPKNIDLKTESLGLTIVRTLVVSQINGTLEMQNQNGTSFIIKFMNRDIQERI